MSRPLRPRLLGIDDGPFDRNVDRRAVVVGVLTEGPDLVEAVAVDEFALDGDDATGFLTVWIAGLRFAGAVQGVVLGGITIAGLGVVDLQALAERTGLPVLAVTRHQPDDAPLTRALSAAGLSARIPLVEQAPRAEHLDEGLWVARAGATADEARRLVLASRGKSQLPEPLRLAHLIGAAVARGESRGRA